MNSVGWSLLRGETKRETDTSAILMVARAPSFPSTCVALRHTLTPANVQLLPPLSRFNPRFTSRAPAHLMHTKVW